MCSMSLGVPFCIRRKGNQQVKCIEVQLKKNGKKLSQKMRLKKRNYEKNGVEGK